MAERVIFLDIDGVLAPIVDPARYSAIDPVCVQQLNAIVAASGADIVVSSSLRYGKTVADLQLMLESAGFQGRVIGLTPVNLRGCTRGEEIQAWLADNPVSGCVILDDHRDMDGLLPHLVQTEPAAGLRATHAARAIAILQMGSPGSDTPPT